MKYFVVMSILLLFLASKANSDEEENKELQEDMEVLVRKYMGNETVTSQVSEAESDYDVEVHQANSHSKRHTKRKRKCKNGRKGKKCSSKSKKRNKTKTPSKKRCQKTENKCWRRVSTKCRKSHKCSRKLMKKCSKKYKKCMSKLKKVTPVVTTTTTTMVTPKSRYPINHGDNLKNPWHLNKPKPQKPDNEPEKKLNGYMEDCQDDGDCYDGMCCTYHGSYRRVCKHNIKKDQVCTKQFDRPKRAMQDWYAQCPCEVGLKCKGTQEDRYWFCRP